jgi:hypothetical protein
MIFDISIFKKENNLEMIEINVKQNLKKITSSQQKSTKNETATMKQSGSGSNIFSGAFAYTKILPLPALPLLLPLPHH